MKPKAPNKKDHKPEAKSGETKECHRWLYYGQNNLYPKYLANDIIKEIHFFTWDGKYLFSNKID